MGRRGHDGRRRSGKVERRRERRYAARPPREGRSPAGTAPANAPATPRPADRATAELGALLGGFLADLDEDLDDPGDDPGDHPGNDPEDGWEDELEDDEDDDEYFALLQDRVRAVVAGTVRAGDAGIARGFVAGCPRGDRVLVDVTVGSWLAKAGRRAEGDTAGRAVRWVAEQLGESGTAVDAAARFLDPDGLAALREPFLRTPDDVLVARVWLLAAVVAAGGARWLGGPDGAYHETCW